MGDKEVVDPSIAAERQPSTGKQHVDMGIKFKVSAKGVHDHSDARGVSFVRYRPRSNSSGGEVKKGVEHDFPIKENNISEFLRQSKYKMLV